MFGFKKKNYVAEESYEWLAKHYKELREEHLLLKARLAGIEDRAVRIHKGEAYYVIQGKDGRFARMQLPAVGGK